MGFKFKEENTFEQRKTESDKIREKYLDRIPVIVENAESSKLPDIDKRKFLVPSDITVAQLMFIIRRRLTLPSEKALFIFIDKTLPATSMSIGEIYEELADADGFLYVSYSGENTFGFLQ